MEIDIKEEYETEDTKKSIDLHEFEGPENDIDCDICGKTLANRAVLEKHVLLVHFNAKLPNTKDIKTIKKRDGVVRHFEKFLLKKKQEPLEKLLTNPEKLESALVTYFKYLGESDKLPSVNTVDAKKSHIKCKIYDMTDGKVDIFNSAKFPKFRRIYNALKRKITSSSKSCDGNSDDEKDNWDLDDDNTTETDSKLKDQIVGSKKGWLQVKSQKKRELIFIKFKTYLKDSKLKPIEELIESLEDLDSAMCQYFQNFKVKPLLKGKKVKQNLHAKSSAGSNQVHPWAKNPEQFPNQPKVPVEPIEEPKEENVVEETLPKMATCENAKSNLKQAIFHLSKGEVDISDNAMLPKFQVFYAEFSKKIRTAEKLQEEIKAKEKQIAEERAFLDLEQQEIKSELIEQEFENNFASNHQTQLEFVENNSDEPGKIVVALKKEDLKQFEIIHENGKKSYKCFRFDCDSDLKSINLLRRHLVEVHEGRAYSCETCYINQSTSIGFKKKTQWYKHSKEVHGIILTKRYFKCNICRENFDTTTDLRQHNKAVHDGQKPWSCKDCDATFKTYHGKNLHEKAIHEGRRYICQICAYSARTNHILKEHIADVHEGRKKPGVICPICGCCLAQKHYLKIHIAQVHEGKKAYPFTCDTCGHGSSRLMDLKAHIASVHDKVKPFVCTHCNAAFTLKQNLNQHVRNVHDRKLFDCEICKSGFKRRGQLKLHMTSVHGETLQPNKLGPKEQKPRKYPKLAQNGSKDYGSSFLNREINNSGYYHTYKDLEPSGLKKTRKDTSDDLSNNKKIFEQSQNNQSDYNSEPSYLEVDRGRVDSQFEATPPEPKGRRNREARQAPGFYNEHSEELVHKGRGNNHFEATPSYDEITESQESEHYSDMVDIENSQSVSEVSSIPEQPSYEIYKPEPVFDYVQNAEFSRRLKEIENYKKYYEHSIFGQTANANNQSQSLTSQIQVQNSQIQVQNHQSQSLISQKEAQKNQRQLVKEVKNRYKQSQIKQNVVIQEKKEDKIRENGESTNDYVDPNNDGIPNFETRKFLQKTVYQCAFCDHKSALFSSLKKHYLSDHPTEEEPSKNSTLFWNKKGIEHDIQPPNSDLNTGGGLMDSLPDAGVYKTAPRTCPICGVTFSGMRGYGYLKVHIEVVHEGIKRHECDICQKRFGTRQNMLKHIKSVHEGIKRKTDKKRSYPCDQCDHVAARRDKLKLHIADVHQNEKPFKCALCTARFKLEENLEKHNKIVHDGKQPSMCDICGKAFSTDKYVAAHIKKVHEGIKPKIAKENPVICSQCGMVFKKSYTLQKHVRTVHEGIKKTQFRCGHCKTNFIRKTELIYHITEVHEK